MILHLISDDKFADYAINQFSEIINGPHFLLITEDLNFEVKYIKNINKVLVLRANSVEFNQFLGSIDIYSVVISHGLFYSWQEELLMYVSEKVKIVWVFWGGEIYGRKDLRSSFFAPKTKILHWQKQFRIKIKGLFVNNESFFVNFELYKRINYCLTDEHEEFEFVKKYTNSAMNELWYNYYSIEETLGSLKDKVINGENILIGNSCTLENNHIDAFYILNKFDLVDRKIIVPLSYGENWLQKKLLIKGKNLFGESFLPLLDFMERDVYNKYLTSCSIIIMNHYRPQAQGNIITSLWLGAKVYMNKKSIQYDYYQRIGICVYSIEEDLKPTNKLALAPLDDDKVEQNRAILMREYGRENMLVRIREIVKVLNY